MYSAVRVFLYATLAPFGLQRVVSFSILCDLYRNDANGTNPFLPFFLEAIEKGTDPVERQYLVHLLCSPPTNRNVSIVVPGSFLGVPNFQGESLALRNAGFRASTSHGTGADGHSLHHLHEAMRSLRRYSSRVTNLISYLTHGVHNPQVGALCSFIMWSKFVVNPFCFNNLWPIADLNSVCRVVATGRQQSARKNALQVIAEYEGTPAGAVEVPDLSALRELYSEKNPAVPSLRYLLAFLYILLKNQTKVQGRVPATCYIGNECSYFVRSSREQPWWELKHRSSTQAVCNDDGISRQTCQLVIRFHLPRAPQYQTSCFIYLLYVRAQGSRGATSATRSFREQ